MLNNATHQSYTGGEFEYDVFVSYPHGDPSESGEDSDLKIWTQALIDKLEGDIGLSVEIQNRPIEVWYDDRLTGNVALTESLKRKIEKSAIFLIIMTPKYLSSKWCKQEREWIETEVKRRGDGIENVFIIRAMPTKHEDWPVFFKDGAGETVLGFRFCVEEKGRAARPFGWVKPAESITYPQFIEARTKLVSVIAAQLDDIRKRKDAARLTKKRITPGILTGDPHWPVFVAPCTEDVRPLSEQVRKLLKQKGCMLLPPLETKIESSKQEDQEQSFQSAHAFVQLFGTAAARPEGEEIGRVQQLTQRSRQHPVEQFLWRDSKIPLTALNDQTYKQFVESLGDIPERTIPELVDEVTKYLSSRDSASSTSQNLDAYYLEVPSHALAEFDRWKEDIDTDDCLLLPLKAPVVHGKVRQIQTERKSRQLVLGECKAVLLIYCIANELTWLKNAIFGFLKDTAQVRRKGNLSPEAVVIDYVGEAGTLANLIGVKVISRKEGSDPSTFWQQLNGVVA